MVNYLLPISLVFGALFYTVIGLAVLGFFLGEQRSHNGIYQLMQRLVSPFLWLAQRLLPCTESPFLRPLALLIAVISIYILQYKIVFLFFRFGWPLGLNEYGLILLGFLGLALAVPRFALHGFLRGVLALLLLEALHIGVLLLLR